MPFYLLASAPLPFLGEIVILFVLGAFIAYLCHRIHLVPIAGFLLTGMFIGPHALGLVEDLELVDMLAEVGVILLLFTIGIEFSLEKLARISRAIFVGGGLQVGVTVGLVTALLAALGVGVQEGIYTGCLVALSSTAVVLGLLADRGETDTPPGQLSLAVLIFQDLAIVVMVMLVPLLSGTGGSTIDILIALAQALLVVGVVVFLARKIVPRLLTYVAEARRQEIFVMAVAAICFGTAWLTSLVGVSLALGAFLAGLVVSESQYSEHALSEILPFRTIFSAVFFISVGMLLDVGFLVERPLLIIGMTLFVLLLKALVTAGAVFTLGYPTRVATIAALGLSQVGEFSFVLERAGRAVELTPAGMGETGSQTFIAVAVLLMLVTPMLLQAGHVLGQWMQDRLPRRPSGPEDQAAPAVEEPLEDHVVIVGYGPAGRRLVQVLEKTDIPFVLIEMNPRSVREARAEGKHVLYGDASRPYILEEAGIKRAKLCTIVINDAAAARRIAEMAHFENPTLQIIARTRYATDIEALQEAGADIVVPEELEASIRILAHVLAGYMVPREDIDEFAEELREKDYLTFRSDVQEAHLMVLEGLDEEGLHTRVVAVRKGAPAERKTLGDLHLRKDYDLTVLAVRRGGRTIGNPSGDFRLQAEDRLVLVGSSDHFAACADLFRETSRPDGKFGLRTGDLFE